MPQCHCEYKAIFEGWQSNKSKKAFNMRKALDAEYEGSGGGWSDLWNNWRKANGLTNDELGGL